MAQIKGFGRVQFKGSLVLQRGREINNSHIHQFLKFSKRGPFGSLFSGRQEITT
jgi:hypothetical protein